MKTKKLAKVITGGVMVVARKGGKRIETEFDGAVEAAGVKAHCEGLAVVGKCDVVFVRWYTEENGKCGIEGQDFLFVPEVVKAVRKPRKKAEPKATTAKKPTKSKKKLELVG